MKPKGLVEKLVSFYKVAIVPKACSERNGKSPKVSQRGLNILALKHIFKSPFLALSQEQKSLVWNVSLNSLV